MYYDLATLHYISPVCVLYDIDTLGYYGIVGDSPQHAHSSRPQILHHSGEKPKVCIGLFSYPKCRFKWAR